MSTKTIKAVAGYATQGVAVFIAVIAVILLFGEPVEDMPLLKFILLKGAGIFGFWVVWKMFLFGEKLMGNEVNWKDEEV